MVKECLVKDDGKGKMAGVCGGGQACGCCTIGYLGVDIYHGVCLVREKVEYWKCLSGDNLVAGCV